jgi:MFS family permease
VRDRLRRFLGIWPRPIWILLVGWVINATGFGMVVPFMSLYFHKERGVPMRMVALVFLVTAVVRAVSGAVAGRLSDRLGRRPFLALAPAGRGASFLVMAFLVWKEASFFACAGVLIGTFIFAAAYQPVAQSAVADLISGERRLKAYAWTRVALNLGWALGPALGGYLSQISYALMFVLGSGLSMTTAIIVALGFPETAPALGGRTAPPSQRRPAGGSRRRIPQILEPLSDRPFVQYALATLFLYLLMAQLVATLPVFAVKTVGIGEDQLGHLYMVNGLLVVLLQTSVTRRLWRFPIVSVQIVASLFYGGFYFLMAFAGGFAALLALVVGITAVEMAATPGTVTVVSRLAPPERMGNYMGVFGLFSNAAWSLGPFLGGLLLDVFPARPVALWGSVGWLGATAAVLYAVFRHRHGDMASGGASIQRGERFAQAAYPDPDEKS